MHRFKTIFFIYCLINLKSFAQPAATIRLFNISNGLPQNNISGMAFDSIGYLWLASTYGAIRYDGFSFKSFLPDTTISKTNVFNEVLGINILGAEKNILIRSKNGFLHTVSNGKLILYDSSVNGATFAYGLHGHFPNEAVFRKFNLSYDELVNKYDWDANTREILSVNANDFIALSNNKRVLFYYKNGSRQYDINLGNEFNFFLKSGKYNLLGDFNDNIYLYDSIARKFNKLNNPFANLKKKNSDIEKPAYYWDNYNDESYCYYNSIFYLMEVDTITKSLQYIPKFSIERKNDLWSAIIYDRINLIYYLATPTDGFYQIKPKLAQTNATPFHYIPIEKVQTDNKILSADADSIYLNANFKFLNIQLSVPHFTEPENLLLEYNMDSSGWRKIQVLPLQNIFLYNLSSGYHQLMIRKRIALGPNDYSYKKLIIFRRKNIYERIWFYPLIIIIFGLLAFSIIKLQTRNIAAKRIALRKLVEKQKAELSKTAEAKELLINIISHDMVTPLRYISLAADLVEKGLENDAVKINTALSAIESTSEKILTESLDILSYMKYNTGKVAIKKEIVNIYSLVNKICEIFVPIAKEKNIVLENNVSKSDFAKIDETIFSIIVNNIISNAVKYAGKGIVEISVIIGPEKNIILKIKDTGAGMNSETLRVIQETLKGNLQAIKTVNKGSTGLGYMLISELAKAHAISVSIESEMDEGTSVSIIIPP